MSVALALLVVLAQAPAQSHAPLRFEGDVPDVIERAPVHGETRAEGIPVRLSAVHSKRSRAELLQYFATRFEKAGLYLPPDVHQPQLSREIQLTALDVRSLVSYSVILQSNDDGSTNVILGEARLAERKVEAASVAPVMPGAQKPSSFRSEGGRVLVYLVRRAPDEVLAFYRQVLARGGYQEARPGVFTNATEELRVDAQSGPEGTSVVILGRDLPAP